MWRIWLLIFFAFTLAGCCSEVILTPAMPEQVRGWKEIKEPDANRVSVGEFLLKKGKTVDNGKFGIQFVDMQRKIECVGPFEGTAPPTGADFRFYRVADGKTLQLLSSAYDRNSTPRARRCSRLFLLR